MPGLSIGVSRNGHCIWKEGFGYADVEQLVPCTSETVMRIASISKPVTAAIAARLVQNKKLDLDASVQDYVPEFPRKKYNGKDVVITVRQLLCHTSGIRHYKKPDEVDVEDLTERLKKAAKTLIDDDVENLLRKIQEKYKEKYGRRESSWYRSVELKDHSEYFSNVHYESVSEALEIFKNDELVAEPGSKFHYTTHGFTLLSAVLEKAAGESYVSQITSLFKELGMNHSYLDFNHTLISGRARYYYRDSDHKLRNAPEVDNSCKWAGGGLLSTVTDLLIFANAMLYSYHATAQSSTKKEAPKPLLNAETLKTFWKGEISDQRGRVYALGWYKIDETDHEYGGLSDVWTRKGILMHTGAAVGASSVLLLKPDSGGFDANGICIAILTNLHECGELTHLACEVAEIFDSAISEAVESPSLHSNTDYNHCND